MLRKTERCFGVATLIGALVCGSVEVARAQSITITDAAIQKAAQTAAAEQLAQSRRRYRVPCDPKQRAKAGAVIGFIAGMVMVNRIAADFDSSAGFKGTLAGGAYGAALGAWLGVTTCR
jgi:hypothetical protein